MTAENQDANGDPTKSSDSESAGLSPAQAKCFDDLLRHVATDNLVVVWGDTGSGKSTLLRRLSDMRGGTLLTIKDVIEAMRGVRPFSIEETFYSMATQALRGADLVLIDDLDVLWDALTGCHHYPRSGFIEVALKGLAQQVIESGKRLVLASDGYVGDSIQHRARFAKIEDFEPDDYRALCRRFLGEPASALDFTKIHRFAPRLNAHQLKSACDYFARIGGATVDTESFIEFLRSRQMASNVHLDEVQKVDLRDLKGIDDIIEALEANIALPLVNDQLATELGIKPKRGVLIAGPPGTGKTTIGRALAHRLKGKFFLIDGTFISGTAQFYSRVHQVFESAKQNSPAVIFIDDSDVIFESGEEHGLYRYLLTMLDGLESESNARVCVMMTAMDVGNLPPALIRSGRVELWLETRLPDSAGREQILRTALADLPPAMGAADIVAIAQATDGLTGADLKRLVEDGKILFGYDTSRNLASRSASDYLIAALTTVRANKQRYARAESQANARRQRTPQRPPWFDVAVQTVLASAE